MRERGGATVGVKPIAAGLFMMVTDVGTKPQGLSSAVSGLIVFLAASPCWPLLLLLESMEEDTEVKFSLETAGVEVTLVEEHSSRVSLLAVFFVKAQSSDGKRVFKPMPLIRPIKSKLSPADASRVLLLGGGWERDLRGFFNRWKPLAIDALPTRSGILTAPNGSGVDGGDPSGEGAGVGVGDTD